MSELDFYTDILALELKKIDKQTIDKTIRAFEGSKTIFVGGNGGSASISNHLVCDFSKGAGLRVVSLSSNTPLITAISNDFSYEDSLSYQLEILMRKGDVGLLISSSGESPNIVKAAKFVKEMGNILIGFCGFHGGKLKELSDICFHVNVFNYGIVEDIHQSIMHMISQEIIRRNNCKNIKS